jgi:hypothetical protein
MRIARIERDDGPRTAVVADDRLDVLTEDVAVLTGSPAGNAAHHGDRWLRPGDVMEGEIAGLGVQRNVCVEESAFRPQLGQEGPTP